MVKNPLKRKKKKNPIEASMPLDKPEAKMVEVSYNKNPFFIGIGLAKKRDVKGTGGVGTEGIKGEYESQKDLDWRIWYNPNALPSGFMPEERLKNWIGGTVAITSGSIEVYNPETKFIETDQAKLTEAEAVMHDSDPNQITFDDWWTSHDSQLENEEKMNKKKKQKSK